MEAPGVFAANDMAANVAGAFRAGEVFGDVAPTTVDMAALAEAARAVRVFKFHGVMVEDFAVILPFRTSHPPMP